MTLYWESQLIIKLDCDSMRVRVRMGFYTIPSKGENSKNFLTQGILEQLFITLSTHSILREDSVQHCNLQMLYAQKKILCPAQSERERERYRDREIPKFHECVNLELLF